MSARTTICRRAAATTAIAGAITLTGAGSAGASHIHTIQTGNGACVLLAAAGGEPDVDLPFASPDLVEADRAHPLHLLVHQGRPGEHLAIGVHGTPSDPCDATGDYVNG